MAPSPECHEEVFRVTLWDRSLQGEATPGRCSLGNGGRGGGGGDWQEERLSGGRESPDGRRLQGRGSRWPCASGHVPRLAPTSGNSQEPGGLQALWCQGPLCGAARGTPAPLPGTQYVLSRVHPPEPMPAAPTLQVTPAAEVKDVC